MSSPMSGTTADPRTRRPTTISTNRTPASTNPQPSPGARQTSRRCCLPERCNLNAGESNHARLGVEQLNHEDGARRGCVLRRRERYGHRTVRIDRKRAEVARARHLPALEWSRSLFSTRASQVTANGRLPVLTTAICCSTAAPRTRSSKAPSTPASRVACIVSLTATSNVHSRSATGCRCWQRRR